MVVIEEEHQKLKKSPEEIILEMLPPEIKKNRKVYIKHLWDNRYRVNIWNETEIVFSKFIII